MSRSPSAWEKRVPYLLVALVALCLPTSSGTPSFISHGPDRYLQIALGLVVLTGCMGGTDRWSKLPWFILAFGILVGPIIFATALWMTLQMAKSGEWEWIGVVRATCALLITLPALGEFLASVDVLRSRFLNGEGIL